jgi:hypothetical protein
LKGEELLDLIESLSDHTYRDSTEVAIAIGKKSGRKKIRSAKEVESNKPPSKKGGNVAASLSISFYVGKNIIRNRSTTILRKY